MYPIRLLTDSALLFHQSLSVQVSILDHEATHASEEAYKHTHYQQNNDHQNERVTIGEKVEWGPGFLLFSRVLGRGVL